MTEKTKNILEKLISREDSFEKMMGHPYPVALWRMPNTAKVWGIADLRPGHKNEEISLEDMPSGFVLNSFGNHHPTKPDLIKADILISWEGKKDPEISLNPVLSSRQLEEFVDEVSKEPSQLPFENYSDRPDYVQNVAKAVEAIKKGAFSKVVLSRFDEVDLPNHLNIIELFQKACKTYPNAFVYLVNTQETGIWFGATPETLISVKDKQHFLTTSLAGTQKLDENQSLNSVAWTQKEIEEQAMVSRYIIDCLKKIRLREFKELGPRTVRAGNLAHLRTEYHIDMKEVNMPQLPGVMLDLLHPTSAVCGMPLQPALEFIRNHEDYNRELYSGFLGPVNIEDLTHLFVNLRCMKIVNGKARFYAGAGITEDSDPEKEFIETQLKMQTLKKLIFSE